ncbi:MAG: dockerin type I repeat-containing protein [Clostridia bacterium]|nr:dockerin type I repeat-containing protein [Clostridia bacterium]
MSSKKKIFSLLLAALLSLSAFFSAFAVSGTAVKAEIMRIYQGAIELYEKNTGSTSFYGNCGVYVSYILNELGIDDYLGGYRGNKWYDAYKDGQKLGEWTVVCIPGADCIQTICDEYYEAHYIVVSYTHQTHYSNEEPGAGHVVFINMIKDDVAYFSESYRMYDRAKNAYAEEGTPIEMDAQALAEDHEKLYGDAIGALMFVKDGLNEKRDPSMKRTTTSRVTEEITQPTAVSTTEAPTSEITTAAAPTAELTTTAPLPTASSTTQHEPMQYTDNHTALAYVVRDLAIKLSFSTDIQQMIVMTSGAPTLREMREFLPDFGVTVRDNKGVPISEDSQIGTDMLLVIKYKEINFIFDISVKGDSGDGRISAKDARTALQISARTVSAEKLSEAQRIAYDINNDGRINTVDARLILRAAAHMISL